MSTTVHADTSSFLTSPATDNCRDIHRRGRHVLLGVSPFNSRFSDAYIARLVRWAHAAFARVDVLLAGERTAALQLEALGTPEGKARYKARRAIRRNRRSVEEALVRLNVRSGEIGVHQISDFEEQSAYRRFLALATTAYERDPAFRGACLEMAAKAVLGRLRTVHGRTTPVTAAQAEHAAPYVLAELPFFLHTPALLGVEESLLAYHQRWELGERIFAGSFTLTAGPHQGYLTVTEDASAGI
ncbi:tRNA-dependent cyclodipeptide synthase [Streptomyces sp. P38-E01]|uniref:Cyclodipeptide synthase n=1 Tax=Streptomyces tardus TaxID=2780544 RepID=A0A949N4U3_9ACTN|nr:tRNA-dependent cyclodipeptide synthase [Streptomyces tardus]MBU7598279.1 tRNA-dependent cyclodipeptide synthase [Streptomyces tardus]